MKTKLLLPLIAFFFSLVSFSQSINDPFDLIACDDDNDGIAIFDIESQTFQILSDLNFNEYTVTYHETQLDANQQINPVFTPYANNSSPQTIFVAVVENSTGNLETTSFGLVVNPAPLYDWSFDLNICSDSQDGFGTFDLTSLEQEFMNGNFNLSVTYYETFPDAVNGSNAIPNPTAFTNTIPFSQNIFVRVSDLVTGCFYVNDVPGLILNVNLGISVNQPTALVACDDDGDGFAVFNLDDKTEEVLNGNSSTQFQVTYHETPFDADNGTNAILETYTNTIASLQTLFVRVSSNFSNCYQTTTLDLIVETNCVAITDASITSCTSNPNLIGVFDLTEENTTIVNGNDLANYNFSYHLTAGDAENQTNPITNTENFTASGNVTIIYVFVEEISTGNSSIATLTLNVSEIPIATFNNFENICSGQEVFLAPEVTGGSGSYEFEWNTGETNEGIFVSIGGTYSVTVTDSIFGCSTFATLDVFEDESPDIQQLPVQDICTNDLIGFDLTQYEQQIASASGLEFEYFFDNASLINDSNQISNATDFDLTVNIETIFVKVSSLNNECFSTTTINFNYLSGEEGDDICETNCQDIDITIITSPVVGNQGVLSTTPGAVVNFNAELVISETDDNFTYSWDFGDGNFATDLNTTYTYNTVGAFDVTLTIFDDNGFDCIETSDVLTVQVLGENVVVTTNYESIEELVENIFVGDQCSQISNITYSTSNDFQNTEFSGIGHFLNASTEFPFTEGIVLSTGNALDASGPNTSTNISSGTNLWPGDADLDALLDISSNNATIIEFDFIPVVNEISFDFLMASEEYDGNTGGSFECNFSDAFAFLLTDAQGVTSNLAVLPNTDIPILVTNIHPENSSCPAINEEFFGGYIAQDAPPIEYNGRTVPFTANAQVNIGESYHIKLVIADDADSSIDSAVFLKAGSFDIGELCNDIGLINAKAFIDTNANGILDNGELDFTNGSFTYEKNNDGIINEVNTSTGNFSIVSFDEADTYSVSFTVYDDYLNCYTVTTDSFDLLSVLDGDVLAINFPVTDNLVCEDLAVYIINSWIAPRPGFSHENHIFLENLGSATIASGTVEFTTDPLLVFNAVTNINPNYTVTTTATGFTVDFVNLQPGTFEDIEISLTCPATVALGEIVTNTATYITDSNDLVANNNVSSLSEIVIGSYDPNDKMEARGPQIVFDDFTASSEYLYYTIRFQNLGTAPATFVRIDDALDSQLDPATFQMLRSSHDYVVTRTDTDLEWFFDDINLPAEQDDVEGSQGFVYFRIKPNAGYAIGDIIPNTAAIFFDFNAPVITNTFNSEFVETLSVSDKDLTAFEVFPNPAKDNITIQTNQNSFGNITVSIVDIQGKLILESQISEVQRFDIDISAIQSGLYFVKLNSNGKSLIKKLIIE
ncbi:DUF7619 domain-containing protein [Psychroserpens sp.]|uniref:DUF7619 domain-containing protein n=1 Tax=Psychroserpens sp. TaxID=2020870 RepID=UPI003C780B3C